MIEPKIPTNEDERIMDLISIDLSNPSKQNQLDAVIAILSKSLKVPIAYISSIETNKQNIHASCGLNFKMSDRSTSFCGHTILQNEMLIVEDTFKDPRFYDNPMVIDEPKIRFYAGFPLSAQSGNNIGSLCISDTVPRKLNENELSIFKMVGRLVNDMIQMNKVASLQAEIQESKRQLEVLNGELYESNKFHRELFGQYMSPSLLDKVLKNKKDTQLGGEEKEVTVLISDLRGFSPLSEQYSAQIIVDILNIYFEEMIDVIHKYDGYINEILGDGILVVFGAIKDIKDSSFKAVQCAREMQKGLKKVNEKLRIKGLPPLEMGIGINNGNLVVGNIGSKRRMKYGVVGENINIAARIESLTVAGQVLISESLYRTIADKIEPIGNIRTKIKGFKKPIMIYDVSEVSV